MPVDAAPIFVGVLWSSETQTYRVMLQSVDSLTGEPRMMSFIPENSEKIGSALVHYSGLVALLNASTSDAMVTPTTFLAQVLGEPQEATFGDSPALLWTGMPTEMPLDDKGDEA